MSWVQVLQGAFFIPLNKGKIKVNSAKKEDQITTMDSIKTYFKGVKSEWNKITWPERQQILVQTVAVFFVVFVFTLIVYLMDILFKGLLGVITNR